MCSIPNRKIDIESFFDDKKKTKSNPKNENYIHFEVTPQKYNIFRLCFQV